MNANSGALLASLPTVAHGTLLHVLGGDDRYVIFQIYNDENPDIIESFRLDTSSGTLIKLPRGVFGHSIVDGTTNLINVTNNRNRGGSNIRLYVVSTGATKTVVLPPEVDASNSTWTEIGHVAYSLTAAVDDNRSGTLVEADLTTGAVQLHASPCSAIGTQAVQYSALGSVITLAPGAALIACEGKPNQRSGSSEDVVYVAAR